MSLPKITLRHVRKGLESTPKVLAVLLLDLRPEDWELRDSGRFSVKETVAHLADWDHVFLERMMRTLEEESPLVEAPDSGERISRYANADLRSSLADFKHVRFQLLDFVSALIPEDLSRAAVHPTHGSISLEAQVVHVLGHDGYHLLYLSELLSAR